MALFLFTKSIINGDSIDIYNEGNMIRDFTYIDDIVESILKLINKPAEPSSKFDEKAPDPSSSWAPYRIFNIGNSQPTHLMDYINALEKELGLKAKKNFMPIQPGDVEATSADTKKLIDWIDFKPSTKIAEGINKFVSWYREYYEC